MTRDEFLSALEETLTVEPGTLKPGVALAQVPEWDSLGVVDFQGLADELGGEEVPPDRITDCETVDDLLALLAGKLSD